MSMPRLSCLWFVPKAEALPLRPREGAPVREAGAERRKPLFQRADREGKGRESHKPAFNSELSPPPLLRVQLRGRGARGLSARGAGGSADARVIYRDAVPPAGVQPAPHNTRSGPWPPGLSQAGAAWALGQSGGSDCSSWPSRMEEFQYLQNEWLSWRVQFAMGAHTRGGGCCPWGRHWKSCHFLFLKHR